MSAVPPPGPSSDASARSTPPPPGVLARCRALAAGHGTPTQVRAYTLAFTLAVTVFFGLLVAVLHATLRARTRLQARAARARVIMNLLGDPAPEAQTGEALARRFRERVRNVRVWDPDAGAEYTYWRGRGARRARVVFPIAGRGFWGMVRGFAGADLERRCLTGVRFTEHEETPGLGGRISEPWFRAQFAQKSLATTDARGRYVVVGRGPGTAPERTVDAITGATGTSAGVQKLMNAGIRRFLRLAGASRRGRATEKESDR